MYRWWWSVSLAAGGPSAAGRSLAGISSADLSSAVPSCADTMRRKCERIRKDARTLSCDFGASLYLLFGKFSRVLLRWPAGIALIDRSTICFRFCDFILRNKRTPTLSDLLDQPQPQPQQYPRLSNFLEQQKNITSRAFTCDLTTAAAKFFLGYRDHPQLVCPALIAFCTFLETFVSTTTTTSNTPGFFQLEAVSSFFRFGGLLDQPVKEGDSGDTLSSDEKN